MKWAIRSGGDQSQTELPLVGGLFFASAGGFRCPHVADDAAEEQGDHAAPEGHMDAKLFAHDGQEEGASARAETADGNGQAYAGAAQFRWEQLRGIGKFRDDGAVIMMSATRGDIEVHRIITVRIAADT